jgi:hypothetical protein
VWEYAVLFDGQRLVGFPDTAADESTSQETTSNRSYFLSAIIGRTARAFKIALSFAVLSSGANMVRECSSPVACLRSLTEYAVLLPVICCSYLMPLDRSLLATRAMLSKNP